MASLSQGTTSQCNDCVPFKKAEENKNKNEEVDKLNTNVSHVLESLSTRSIMDFTTFYDINKLVLVLPSTKPRNV